MNISDRTKGYLWTLVSVLAVSNVYIFSKKVMNMTTFPQFGFWWFFTGALIILTYGLATRSFGIYKTFGKKEYALLLLNGILELSGTYFFFKAIHTVENPSIVSFLNNISPVFVVILGVLFLKEKINLQEFIGIVIALSGTVLLSYKGGTRLQDMFIPGTEYAVLSMFIFAFNTILLKKYVKRLSPVVLTINRVIFLTTFFFIFLLLSDDPFFIPREAYYYVLIGSFLGPFLTVIASLNALKYIEVSKKSILGTTKGLFVLLGSYFFFGNFPTSTQIIGGLLTITGAVLIITGRMTKRKKRKVSGENPGRTGEVTKAFRAD
ncbi:MAG: DMT family transporter [Chlorobi bacterium]|nr:DMT family transporter [Chlorobiota bacterium]